MFSMNIFPFGDFAVKKLGVSIPFNKNHEPLLFQDYTVNYLTFVQLDTGKLTFELLCIFNQINVWDL